MTHTHTHAHIHTKGYYSAIKKNEKFFATTRMDLESTMHSAISQTEKDKALCDLLFCSPWNQTCNISTVCLYLGGG